MLARYNATSCIHRAYSSYPDGSGQGRRVPTTMDSRTVHAIQGLFQQRVLPPRRIYPNRIGCGLHQCDHSVSPRQQSRRCTRWSFCNSRKYVLILPISDLMVLSPKSVAESYNKTTWGWTVSYEGLDSAYSNVFYFSVSQADGADSFPSRIFNISGTSTRTESSATAGLSAGSNTSSSTASSTTQASSGIMRPQSSS